MITVNSESCPFCHKIFSLTSLIGVPIPDGLGGGTIRQKCVGCGARIDVVITVVAGPTRKDYSLNIPEEQQGAKK